MTIRHPEYQYLDLLQQVLDHGDQRVDLAPGRHEVGLWRDGAVRPLRRNRTDPHDEAGLWKTAIKEMLWFLTGGTSLRDLLRENVRIWTDWPLARVPTGNR